MRALSILVLGCLIAAISVDAQGVQVVDRGGGIYRAEAAASRVMFDDAHSFEVGGTQFDLFHTPGETPDHLTVGIPKLKAAFVGDLSNNSNERGWLAAGIRDAESKLKQ